MLARAQDHEPLSPRAEGAHSTLADRLRFALDRADMSQAELAARAGVTKGSVSNWILGRVATIKSDTINKIADLLRVDPRWLVSGEGDYDKPAEPHRLAEVIDFEEALQRASQDQRELLSAIASAAYKSVTGVADKPQEEAEPPGANMLARVFRTLESGTFAARFDKLPSRAKGILVATLCTQFKALDDGEELDIGAIESLIENMIAISQHLPE